MSSCNSNNINININISNNNNLGCAYSQQHSSVFNYPANTPVHFAEAYLYEKFSPLQEASSPTQQQDQHEGSALVPTKREADSCDEEDMAQKGLVEEEEEEENGEVKITDMHAPLEISMKNILVCLIGEYLNEIITLRQFLAKIRQCLCSDGNVTNKEVFVWMLRCMIEGESGGGVHVHRMASFLEENGICKQEIEASSVAIKDEQIRSFAIEEVGEKRKKRDKKSISRGLRSAPNKWSKTESQTLIRLVHENGDKSWKKIAEQLGGGKTGAQCAQHWKRVLSPQIRKGSWDDKEEELLLSLVDRYGQSWKNIAGEIKSRTDIQCRYQYQKSCLSRQCEWQDQEDALLMKKVAQMHHEAGVTTRANSNVVIAWVEVAKFIARAKLTKIPRTALECKQRWRARSIIGQQIPLQLYLFGGNITK